MLLTYRLLFALDHGSRREWAHATQTCCQIPKEYSDPLLPKLCGQSCESEEIRRVFEFLGTDDPSNDNHYVSTDFPFLGKRLLKLQRYVDGIRPVTPRVLWDDRRELEKWWNFRVSTRLVNGDDFVD